jgi:protein O-mannosyl-transferase
LPNALQRCAWIEATDARADLRNGTNAVTMATRACALSKDYPRRRSSMLITLAAAYAEAGRFDDAVNTAEEARALADKLGQKGLEARAASLKAIFAQGKPYRGEMK